MSEDLLRHHLGHAMWSLANVLQFAEPTTEEGHELVAIARERLAEITAVVDAGPQSTVPAPIPCPVRSPDGLPCRKTIQPGWLIHEGHAGGHFWADDRTEAIMRGGHYDARAAVAGEPFDGHPPQECPGSTCQWAMGADW